MAYDRSNDRDHDDKDRAFWNFIEDIDADLQHLLAHSGRYGPQNAYRDQKPDIFPDHADNARNGYPERLGDFSLMEVLIIIHTEVGDEHDH
jgi:hypothetical protein